MNAFDEFAQSLTPHPSKARIIVELVDCEASAEKALETLRDQGIHSVEYELFRKEHFVWIQILLPPEYIQESVLTLSEAGFTNIKGIGPQHKPGRI